MDESETEAQNGHAAILRACSAQMADNGETPWSATGSRHSQTLVIDGVNFVSLAEAVMKLSKPGDPYAVSGRERVLSLLQSGDLPCKQLHPAPPHELAEFSDEGIVKAEFWTKCWWFGFSGHDTRASSDWIDWLLQGGILVQKELLDTARRSLEHEWQLRNEARIANTFQYLWPATSVLAWIVSRDDRVIEAINAAREQANGAGRSAWQCLAEIAEQHRRANEQTYHNALWRAFDDLVPKLLTGQLKAWEASSWRADAAPLEVRRFLKAGLVEGANTCGLLGVGLLGQNFVLMSPEDVKGIWPAQASEPGAISKAMTADTFTPTGDPGRPSKGYHLYDAEHRRRCKSREAHDILAQEACHLVAWFKQQYPSASPPTQTTVQNRIRKRHREYVTSAPQN